MFCPNCGMQLPDGSVFCGSCGTKLSAAQAPAQQSEYQQHPQMAQQQWQQQPAAPKRKLSKGKLIGIVAAVVVVILAAMLAMQGAFIPKGWNGATITPQRLYEDDGVTIDVTDLRYDKDRYYQYGIGLKVTNRYDSTIVVNCEDLVIYIDDRNPTCVGSGKIEPGQTAADRELAFGDYGKGYGKIKTITFTLEIGEVENDQVVDRYTAGTYTLTPSYAK